MYENNFFIMLHHPNGSFIPLDSGESNHEFRLATFPSEKVAREVAENNDFAQHFGYEIFDITEGV